MHHEFRRQRREVSVYSPRTPDQKLIKPNYCTFDQYGNLFFSTSCADNYFEQLPELLR
jgi:hypothetical protein